VAGEEPVKTRGVAARAISRVGRLDAKFMLSAGRLAQERIEAAKAKGLETEQLGGIAKVILPKRFKRAYAAPGEPGVPYLRPYDVFDFIPEAADMLSAHRSDVGAYQLERGLILQTCSGRNLGPAVVVDRYLERFCLSHDMVRIRIVDDEIRNYVLAYLNSETGQQLLTRDKTGSVIDHIDDHHVASQEIPLLDAATRGGISALMSEATRLREQARLVLNELQVEFESNLPGSTRDKPLREGWSVDARGLTGRLDAASHDPLVKRLRSELLSRGGQPAGTLATVVKPPGRYKTAYVEAPFGKPMLSGRQLLQTRPINLRRIALGSLKNTDDYILRAEWLAYQADGRAEERLGCPVLITADRDGWLASGHVARMIPRNGVHHGWLYLAVRSTHAQLQLKSRASGSVVDATFPSDMEDVILPPRATDASADEVLAAWEGFVLANEAQDTAISRIDDALEKLIAS
jgi:hypothetical protein